MRRPPIARSFIREIVFGLEDSLVSTVGAVTGMAVGFTYAPIVVFGGIVIVLVEAFSMAAGSYLSSKTAGAIAHNESEGDLLHPVLGAGIMGLSYIVAGLLPLFPYMFLGAGDVGALKAAPISIVLTLIALFYLGVWGSRYTKRSWWKSGLEMFVVGGAAILLGFLVARLLVFLNFASL